MSSSKQSISAQALLDAAVNQLGFTEGELLPAEKQAGKDTRNEWLEKGDWLALAKAVGAERVFFVDQYPVVVFARLDDESKTVLRNFYNRIWCMARPQLLFLARPGELAVYDLGKPPIKPGEAAGDKGRLLSQKIEIAAEVQGKLAQFRREEIESGRVFGDSRFAGGAHRADRALIRDLRIVRQELLAKGLEARHAHALIGRSIFIRYLEDRDVLVRSYFENVAARRNAWKKLLADPLHRPFGESDLAQLCYPRVLQDKDFTYALFDQLAEDFNGDTFPVDREEREKVKPAHLELLKGLLLGDTTEQQHLFFFAYRFDVIPIELISSIYEEFYNEQQGKEKNHGSHYTPSALVDFVLSRTLTREVLERSPRVMDPACGSGIFLVESFRRIVRHQIWKQDGKRLSRPQLRKILRDQIAGIDINEEAVRVAAFSLYLAFLHYQEPREINEQRRLPNLKWATKTEREEQYDILLHGNAFDAVGGKLGPEIAKRFGAATAHVVVGNPPWGYPKKSDEPGRKALKRALEWCGEHKYIVGDNELSQAFIHFALEVLKDRGRAGMLVSSGVFFKHQQNSRDFRKQWLSQARLQHVVNFAHVRHVFFRGETRKSEAIAPFASVVFEKNVNHEENRFEYWSAKRTAYVENAQAVIISKGDMHWLSQQSCLTYEKIWKIYWWGGHRDEALIRALERFPSLTVLPKHMPRVQITPGQGFKEANKQDSSDWLGAYRELPIEEFHSYGPLDFRSLRDVPSRVERKGIQAIYEGHRLLVRRGVGQGGRITARLESRPFCFRNSINGYRLVGLEPWQETVLLGIYWSSLARYYFFLTAGSWGLWHDEIYPETVAQMPIHFPEDADLRRRIVDAVEKLQSLNHQPEFELGNGTAQTKAHDLERQLDDAIFDLYGLNRAERDLVRDMCEIGLDFFYHHQKSLAVEPTSHPGRNWGTQADASHSQTDLGAYLTTFLQVWNKDLEPDAEFAWHVMSPSPQSPLVAVLFSTRLKTERMVQPEPNDGVGWTKVLKTVDKHSHQTAGSRRIYTDSFVRLLSEDEILLIKRNEVRFWTRSAAREDAEATQLQAMQLQEAKR